MGKPRCPSPDERTLTETTDFHGTSFDRFYFFSFVYPKQTAMERIELFLIALLSAIGNTQTVVKIMIAMEEADSSINGFVNDAVSSAERDFGKGIIKVDVSTVEVDREYEDESYNTACAVLYGGVSLILDMTWTGWNRLREIAADTSVAYVRGDATLTPFVQAMDDLLTAQNATDAALIFETEKELNQTLYFLIGYSIIRVVVLDELNEASTMKVRAMRPSPSYYVIYATSANMETLFKAAIDGGLVRRDGTWNLVFTDYNYQDFRYIAGDVELNVSINILTMKNEVCCSLIGESPCTCPNDFQTFPRYFKRLIGLLVSVMSEVQKSGVTVEPKVINCKNNEDVVSTDNTTVEAFKKNLLTKLSTNHTFEYLPDRNLITYRAEIELKTLTQGRLQKIGEWNRQHKITTDKGMEIKPARRFFRIGTAQMIPWSYVKKNAETQQPVLDEEGKEVWEGYCIDLMKKLAETMDFDYELVIPASGDFGERLPNGKWTGIVGDLLRGEIDIAVAALTMTSEREEVIDFVAPYYEQSGILIAIRKPVRKTSLFKFMTVLRLEVWLSIVGALTVTGIMIWLLDKYSPYSARNNKNLYPYPCREFTLKESFWFALTSFTPQGGGEAPKALSGRTLVAAYWLFVVLMLATFTANLAAFLTVERMQSPVQSLEQLARQSRINYTVLANSHVHQYFINMKNAEDKLYTVWKEITLNSTSEQVEYRVWDYPIKEQYGHILQAITQAGPVESARAGFQKVIDSENAEFAFIHDSGEIKYEVTKNCNLTEVGEVFAEQPYAIAVQQGSHLQEEISKRILDLQKDRYFETLSSKYWNQSLRESCPNSDDSEGITLESLGGVFIATLFGLALAMITLAGEVIFYRKRKVSRKEQQPPAVIKSRKIPTLQMKPAPVVSLVDRPMKNIQPRVSHISVYPRHFAFKE
ncbi:ionotropic receptor 25a isoform X1 [Diprion similis]|uniref:ionotropic receptor 25a isoform X1 n=1 Tax=Diprion similis TaxID=362088 RepID=UPI001EF91FF0|nr:ionotropic receptor 25a isoform X1 [Diprion similis]XP_046753842.1 ionotropic receptor 25a isoform X1 [Diprion similis]